MTYDEVLELDKREPLCCKRSEFALPEGMIYLDGNSFGAFQKWHRLERKMWLPGNGEKTSFKAGTKTNGLIYPCK